MCDTQIKKKKSLDYQVQLYDLTRQSTLSRTLTPRLKLGIARLRLRRDFSSSLDSQVLKMRKMIPWVMLRSLYLDCRILKTDFLEADLGFQMFHLNQNFADNMEQFCR
nr:PREDICTED: uncharacterized protein LOC108194618 [Daucus carota subsp. sativus]